MFPAADGATVGRLDTFDDVLAGWIDAEARGDATALDALLDDDFRGDGPRGYVLTKQQWLDRYRRGDLANDAFAWEDTRVRVHDDAAVAMGIQAQTARYRGLDCSGRFLGTLVAARRDGRWLIVNVQLSPPTDPPGAQGISATAGP
ncbi:MAG TPA: nuclear transport factor 2 family protein [Acidimicrobiales bacterium]|nr:nuclear transport factor 2 family protein [Acidimicrobiales bacterium]